MNKDKRNKYLILAAALVLCAVLVVLIGTQMNQAVPQPPAVVDESESSSEPAEVVIPELPESSKDESKVTVPDNPSSVKPQEGAAVSSGTEQTIQDDVSKPEPPPPPEPDGETRDTDEPPPYKPEDTSKPPASSSTPEGGKPGEVYVPGFGWVPESDGETSMGTADSDGDINKPVGNM